MKRILSMRRAFSVLICTVTLCANAASALSDGVDQYKHCEAEAQSMSELRHCLFEVSHSLMMSEYEAIHLELEQQNNLSALKMLKGTQALFDQYMNATCEMLREVNSEKGWVTDDIVHNCYSSLIQSRAEILKRFKK